MDILYICMGNKFRSPMAEALTRKQYPEKTVDSAGTHADGTLAGITIELMQREDADQHLKDKPEKVTQDKIDRADRIIVMKQRQKDFLKQHFAVDQEIAVWDVDDVPPADPDDVLDSIRQHVDRLDDSAV